MADKILAKDGVAGFLARLKEGREVYAPTPDAQGRLGWAPAGEAGDLRFAFSNTHLSPKDFFFPQTECLMTFANRADQPDGLVMQPAPALAKPRALLNVRPCDAKAFAILDRIFCQDAYTNDAYWRDKREKTVLVGLACNDPCPTCFCTSMNCGPHHEVGLDLLLVELDDAFLVRVLGEKGAALVADLPEAGAAETAQAAELKRKAEAKLAGGVTVDLTRAGQKTVLELFKDPMWDRVFESCLNCGTCTFCCPTCHCFDIQDETQGDQGRRVRNWDYCMSWLFTVHGTGHNPRPGSKERVRQRFLHKLKYIPEKRGGEIGCVGCGRCVQLCPVNIDIREVANRMNA